MGFMRSLGEAPHLYDVLVTRPRMSLFLFKMLDEIMFTGGTLSMRERELIAAYVSGINACSFCYRGHKAIAEVFGVEEGLLDLLVDDLDSAPLDRRLRPVLCFARKLTEQPSRLVQSDADALYDAGYNEEDLMIIVEVVAVFAMFNRIADGTGVRAENTATTLTAKHIGTYTENLVRFGLKVPSDLQPLVSTCPGS